MSTRTRSRSDVASVTGTRDVLKRDPSTEGPVTSIDTHVESQWYRTEFTQQMTDIVTPRFQQLKGKGLIINNPMTKTDTITNDTGIRFGIYLTHSAYLDDGTGYKWYDGSLSDTGLVKCTSLLPQMATVPSQDPVDFSYLIDQVVTSARAKINLSDAQVLVAVSEAEKTIVSLARILKRIIKIYANLSRMGVRATYGSYRAYRALKSEVSLKKLADRYMELRYVIRPLMYDAADLTKAFNNLAKVGDRLTFRAYDKTEEASSVPDVIITGSRTPQLSAPSNKAYQNWTIRGTATREFDVRAGFITEITDLSPLQAFGLDDLAESAWELLPFSFVADWFVNLGEKIAAWTPERGLRPLASWVVSKETYTRKNICTGAPGSIEGNGPSYRIKDASFIASGSYSLKTITTVRTPNPKLGFWPTRKLRLNSLKLLDLAIILRKLIRK